MNRLASFIRNHAQELVSECAARAARAPARKEPSNAGAHTSQLLDRLANCLQAGSATPDALRDLASDYAATCYREGVVLADLVRGYSVFRRAVLSKYAGIDVPELRDRLDAIGFLSDCVDVAISSTVEQFAAETARDRDLLIATVNHDLGNEVGVVRMVATSIAEDSDLPPLVHERALIICDSTKLMARMVADLSDFTQVQFGGRLPIEPRPCDLADICRRAAQGTLAAASGRDLVVRSADSATGNWDPDRLTQLVRNLLTNAIQHGDGAVVVAIGPTKDGSGVQLTVSNNGPAISPERLRTLFEPRRRSLTSRSPERPRGAGLGLYMVKTIAEAHGGHVTVESTAEGGTVFMVRLPIDSTRAPEAWGECTSGVPSGTELS